MGLSESVPSDGSFFIILDAPSLAVPIHFDIQEQNCATLWAYLSVKPIGLARHGPYRALHSYESKNDR